MQVFITWLAWATPYAVNLAILWVAVACMLSGLKALLA